MSSRLKKGPLDFTVGVLNRLKQQALVSHLLYLQIQKIIKRKMSKGSKDKYTKNYLYFFYNIFN